MVKEKLKKFVKKYRPFKNIRKRIHLWYILFSILIFLDEYLKEGYFVKWSDFTKPMTHENLWLVLTIVYIFLYYNIKYKKRKKRER